MEEPSTIGTYGYYIMYSRTCALESDSVFPDMQNTHFSLVLERVFRIDCVLCIVYCVCIFVRPFKSFFTPQEHLVYLGVITHCVLLPCSMPCHTMYPLTCTPHDSVSEPPPQPHARHICTEPQRTAHFGAFGGKFVTLPPWP